jgi:hypothetical protein
MTKQTVLPGHEPPQEVGEKDFYPTPNWVTEGLLSSPVAPPKGSYVLEPFVGEGAMSEVLEERGHKVHGVELRASAAETASQHCSLGARVGDTLEIGNKIWGDGDYSKDNYGLKLTLIPRIIVTNPPWSIWHECLACLLAMDPDYLALILPWPAPCQARAIRYGKYMFTDSKHCLPIVGRAQYDPRKDGTGMSDSAWFVWYKRNYVKRDGVPRPYMIPIRKAA